MGSRRLHYATLNMYGDTEMTYKEDDGIIRVTFEKAVTHGFNTAVFDEYSNLESNVRFNNSELGIFRNFVLKCMSVMKELILEEGYQ